MRHGRTFLQSVRVLARGEFWSFQVMHALFGGLLTVGGAVGALFIGDGLQRSIADVDGQISTLDARLESIKGTLAQFRVVQSNGIILGALASGSALRPEYSDSFTQLMFTLRHGPAMALLGELYLFDPAGLTRESAELDKLQAAASAPGHTLRSWDDFLAFEMTREKEVMDLQSTFLDRKVKLEGTRQHLQASLDTATTTGIIVQQVGFVLILLAGLIHQHVRSREAVQALARGTG